MSDFNTKGYLFYSTWYYLTEAIGYYLDCFSDPIVNYKIDYSDPLLFEEWTKYAVDLVVLKVIANSKPDEFRRWIEDE